MLRVPAKFPKDVSRQNPLRCNVSAKAKKIYEIIWNTSVQSCMANSIYNIITCIIEAPQDSEFQYKIEDKLFFGWEIINTFGNCQKPLNKCENLKIVATQP